MDISGPWPRCPEAATFFENLLQDFTAANPTVARLAQRLYEHAGVQLLHLVDHWELPEGAVSPEQLTAYGLMAQSTPEGDRFWKHPGARLPSIRFSPSLAFPRLAVRVEDVPAFLQQNAFSANSFEGDPLSCYEYARIALPQGELMPVARRGYAGYRPGVLSDRDRKQIDEALQAFRNRNREGDDIAVTRHAQTLFRSVADTVGRDRAVEEFFAAERDYWMQRNRAGRWQYRRQQELGIGWANHDHHTYRSSRAAFRALMELWHTLGFIPRERFYAGVEAGWGAQVLEHATCRIILFCDLDIAPEELDIDFAQTDLPEREALGTIGLWCALHGGSIAQAGLHHLEAEFDFARATALHQEATGGVMPPFTDLPVLKQAFTRPEIWPVLPARVEVLQARGLITTEQADRFRTQGAAGSHLEILQRWEGFKGFNKTGVSQIILQTDARRCA